MVVHGEPAGVIYSCNCSSLLCIFCNSIYFNVLQTSATYYSEAVCDREIANLIKSSIYSAEDVPVSLYIIILVGIFWNSICNYSLILPYSTTHLCNLVQLYSVPNDTIKTKTPFSFIGVNTALRNIQPAASGMEILSHMQYAVLYTVCQFLTLNYVFVSHCTQFLLLMKQ